MWIKSKTSDNRVKDFVDIPFLSIFAIAAILIVIHFCYKPRIISYQLARKQLQINLRELEKGGQQEVLNHLLQNVPSNYKDGLTDFIKPFLEVGQLSEVLSTQLQQHRYAGLMWLDQGLMWIENYYDGMITALGLFLALSIYKKQLYYGEYSQKKLEKLVNKSVFKEDKGAVKRKFVTWVEDPQTEFIIWYFPISIIPGFWVDKTLFELISPIVENHTRIKFLFIGPFPECPSFNEVVKKVAGAHFSENCKKKGFRLKDTVFYKSLDLEKKFQNNTITQDDLEKQIKKLYQNKVDTLNELAKHKNNVRVHALNIARNNLPRYPFVFRGSKVGEEFALDMLIADTHRVLGLSGATDLIGYITKDFDYVKLSPTNIVTPPATYIVELSSITNLLVQTLIDTVVSCDSTLKNFLACK